MIRKESLLFSKETPQGELEVRKFKDRTYHVFVNNEEHAWFDKDDLTSLKYYLKYKKDIPESEIVFENLKEDTVQKANGKWTNRGDDGTEHGEFDTKAEADAQRKAMFASGWKGESLKEELKTYYISYKENEGKFKGKYVDLPIKANSKAEAEEKFLKDHPDVKSYDYKVIDGNHESLDEKLNLDKEGKALKQAIKNIVVDNDDELREFVSAIVEEVISERKGLEESVDNPEEFNVGDRVAFVGRPAEDKGTIVTGVGDVIQKDGRTYKVKVLDDRINTKKGQVITIDGMSLYNKSYFD